MINTEFLTDPPVDIPAGEMQFFDYVSPPLPSGTYTIETRQQIVWDKADINQEYDKNQVFKVSGPRFTLDPSDVHSLFPPANGQGTFGNQLPHIVLNKRTLPWERTIDGKSPTTPPSPWMALLLFDESEAPELLNKTVAQVLAPDQDILGPQDLKDVSAVEKQAPCIALKIPAPTFTKVTPRFEELPYLCHAREVNMGHKEIFGLNASGWFAVVIGNRFPKTDSKNIACLVSLEGFKDYLPGGTKDISQYKSVQLFALASWSFTAQGQESFSELMTNMSCDLLRLPQSVAEPATKAEKLVNAAFHDGYAALDYTTRQGEKTAAWYRGPFTPVILKNAQFPSFFSAEAAMIYDQKTGLFDLSYAVAWQIGRLLALSDRDFAVGLLNWRRKNQRNIDLLVERMENKKSLGEILHLPDSLEELLDPHLITDKIETFLTTTLAQRVAPKDPKDKPLFRTADPTGVRGRPQQLPGLLSKEEILDILSKGKPFFIALKEKIFAK
ncbi:MAG: hypothetical protein PVH61_12985 [Candidatus Aminicenantes bacterium]|jgi:hypothetical protein